MTNQEMFIDTFGKKAWQKIIALSGNANEFKVFWTSPYKEKEAQWVEDAVSRQAVLNIISKHEEPCDDRDGRYIDNSDNVVWDIRDLPSVNPQKAGKWISVEEKEGLGNWKCSCCDSYFYSTNRIIWRYCPYCGSRMSETTIEDKESER